MKMLLLLLLISIKVELAAGQVSLDTVFLIDSKFPSYESIYNLHESKKDEIESKGACIDEDIQAFARIASETKGADYKTNLDKKLKKMNIQTVWINENEKGKYLSKVTRIEFGYQVKIFKKGGKMMGPTFKVYDKNNQLVMEDFENNFLKKLKKYKS